ncbi:MAG: UDP-N-acetylmuramate--L-alanine ligase [Clostridia bacterium]|nr:UDP-N-acetylmuramate--L-alanine ligase [Clostridia bacterium]
MEREELYKKLSVFKNLHFSGIGGVSMSSLARWAKENGYNVTGYDRNESDAVTALRNDGITVYTEHTPEAISSADAVIYTVALQPDDPELVEAGKHNVPTIARGDFLGFVMSHYNVRIGISGTHGKSTTTAMIAHIFESAGKDPTIECGASIKEFGGNCKQGKNRDFFIYEACEYKNSFLSFIPTDAIINNVELDHTDFFPNVRAIRKSFKASIATADTVYVNIDNKNAVKVVKKCGKNVITASLSNPKADYYAVNITPHLYGHKFLIMKNGGFFCGVTLSQIGTFNIYNAVMAAAVAANHGISPETIGKALSDFSGVAKRFEKIGSKDGVDVFDDYAHHPDEVRATVNGLSAFKKNNIYLVFQPHTYTRTKDLWKKWVRVLKLARKKGINVILNDIYPARETDTLGVSSEMLANACKVKYIGAFDKTAEYLKTVAKDNDMILTMGAGQAYIVGKLFLK